MNGFGERTIRSAGRSPGRQPTPHTQTSASSFIVLSLSRDRPSPHSLQVLNFSGAIGTAEYFYIPAIEHTAIKHNSIIMS